MAVGILASSAAVTAQNVNPTYTFVKPTGLADGHWWVVAIKLPDSGTTVTTAPVGFTSFPSNPVAAASPAHSEYVYYKYFDGVTNVAATEPNRSITISVNRQCVVGAIAITGATGTLDATASGAEGAAVTTHTLPSIVTTVANTLILAIFGQESAAYVVTQDADYSLDAEAFNTTSTNGMTFAHRAAATAATYNADQPVTDISGRFAAVLLAFAPAGGAATNVDAGHTSGTGAANVASPNVAPNAGHTSGTGAAGAAAAAIAGTAGHASGTGAASAPAPAIAVTAGHASGAGQAFDATVSTAVDTNVDAGHASGTGEAGAASASVAPNAGNAAGTGAANQPSASVVTNAGHAGGTGTAYDATISTASQTSVNAGHASGTGSAFDASIHVQSGAGHASGAGTAYAPSGTVEVSAGHAAAAGAAYGPSAGVTAGPGAATGVGTAYGPSLAIIATAGHASGTGTAYDATAGEPTTISGLAPRIVSATAGGSRIAEATARGSVAVFVEDRPPRIAEAH